MQQNRLGEIVAVMLYVAGLFAIPSLPVVAMYACVKSGSIEAITAATMYALIGATHETLRSRGVAGEQRKRRRGRLQAIVDGGLGAVFWPSLAPLTLLVPLCERLGRARSAPLREVARVGRRR